MVKTASITKVGNISLSKGQYMAMLKRNGGSKNNVGISFSCSNSPNVNRTQSKFQSCSKKVTSTTLNFENIFPRDSNKENKKGIQRVPTPKGITKINKVIQKSPIQKSNKTLKNNNSSNKKSQQNSKNLTQINMNSKSAYNKSRLTVRQKQIIKKKEELQKQIEQSNKENINISNTSPNNNINTNNKSQKLPLKQQQQTNLKPKRQPLQTRSTNILSKSCNFSEIKQQPWHKVSKDLKTRHTFFKPPQFSKKSQQQQQKNEFKRGRSITNQNNNIQKKTFQGYQVKFLTPKKQIFEFNCFKEKDLNIQKDFTDLIQNNMDNDMETDDEQIHLAVRNVFLSVCKSVRDEQLLQLQERQQVIEQQFQLEEQVNEEEEEEENQNSFQQTGKLSSKRKMFLEDEFQEQQEQQQYQNSKISEEKLFGKTSINNNKNCIVNKRYDNNISCDEISYNNNNTSQDIDDEVIQMGEDQQQIVQEIFQN